jgi:hypothetical protein
VAEKAQKAGETLRASRQLIDIAGLFEKHASSATALARGAHQFATVADDDIAIGSVADRCLLSGVIQTSHFKGVRTVFDPPRSDRARVA